MTEQTKTTSTGAEPTDLIRLLNSQHVPEDQAMHGDADRLMRYLAIERTLSPQSGAVSVGMNEPFIARVMSALPAEPRQTGFNSSNLATVAQIGLSIAAMAAVMFGLGGNRCWYDWSAMAALLTISLCEALRGRGSRFIDVSLSIVMLIPILVTLAIAALSRETVVIAFVAAGFAAGGLLLLTPVWWKLFVRSDLQRAGAILGSGEVTMRAVGTVAVIGGLCLAGLLS